MVTREAWEHLGGMDERFSEGWGCEDACFSLALTTLCGQPAVMRGYKAVHLEHAATPGPEGTYRWPGQAKDYANLELTNRYSAANGNPDAMRDLVQGASSVHVAQRRAPSSDRHRRAYTCERCGGTFEKIRSDEEAMAEARSLWTPETMADEQCVICDDCFGEFMEWAKVKIPGALR